MILDLRGHLALMLAECARAEAAPQSLRRALLAAQLVDALAERVFDTWRGDAPEKVRGAGDIIAYRAALAVASPAVAALDDFCSGRDGRAELRREMVPVDKVDQHRLLFADWMITTYNDMSVPTLMLVQASGTQRQFHPLVAEATAFWRHEFETRDL